MPSAESADRSCLTIVLAAGEGTLLHAEMDDNTEEELRRLMGA